MAAMVDLVRLRAPGTILGVLDHHWQEVRTTAPATFGLAIDAAEKEHAAVFGAVISEKFAPHDFRFTWYYDIKSTQGKWLSLQWSEVIFAEQEVAQGRDVFYPIYLQHEDAVNYSFIGYTRFGKIRAAMKQGHTPYWSMTTVRANLI